MPAAKKHANMNNGSPASICVLFVSYNALSGCCSDFLLLPEMFQAESDAMFANMLMLNVRSPMALRVPAAPSGNDFHPASCGIHRPPTAIRTSGTLLDQIKQTFPHHLWVLDGRQRMERSRRFVAAMAHVLKEFYRGLCTGTSQKKTARENLH